MLTEFQKEFLKTIIGIPSVGGVAETGAPYGRKPREVLDAFLSAAERNGFQTGIAGDRVGWVEFGEGEKLLGIICHLDVVPVSDGWNSDPFTLTFAENGADGETMYARGTVDDKGPACAAFFAMKELYDNGWIPGKCRVRLILGTDEERTCSCIQYYAQHCEIPDFAITPDSVFPVIFSEKGILQLRIHGKNPNHFEAHGGSAVNIVPDSAWCRISGKELHAAGKAVHASKPELGNNAIIRLAEAMEAEGIDLSACPVMQFVRDFDRGDLSEMDREDETGCLTSNVGMLHADQEGCSVRIDFRIPASLDCDSLIRKTEEKASAYGLNAEVTLNLAPLSMDRESPEISKLTAIWARHMDQFTGFQEAYRAMYQKPMAMGMGTYARHIPHTVAFGIQAPWQTDQCHQANEHVAVRDFVQWIAVIREFITAFAE